MPDDRHKIEAGRPRFVRTARKTTGSASARLFFNFDLFVTFDDIAYVDIVVILDVQSAFEPVVHLFDVILETLQRTELAGVDHDAVAGLRGCSYAA